MLCSAERILLLPEVPPESIENCGAVHVHYNQYFTFISINKCVQNCVKLDCAVAICLSIEMIHEQVWQPHSISLWGLCLYNIRPPCQDDGMKVVAL